MMVTMALRMLVRAPVMLVAALAVSISINARLAMVMLVAIPLLVIAIGVLMSMCNHLFQVLQTRIDALNGTVQENLVGIRVVKAFVRAGYEKTKFKKSNDDLTKAAINVDMRVIAMMPIMMIALNGATAAVLYLGGSTVMSGGMLIGDLSSFITYIFQILMSVMMLGMSLLQLSRAIACAAGSTRCWRPSPPLRTAPAAPTRCLRPRARWNSAMWTSSTRPGAPGRMFSPTSTSPSAPASSWLWWAVPVPESPLW